MRIHIHGRRGVTQHSLDALVKVLKERPIVRATMTAQSDDYGDGVFGHGFILEDGGDDLYLITDGFSSGYSGEGPRGLVEAVRVLQQRGIPLQWAFITREGTRDLFDGKTRVFGVRRDYLRVAQPVTVLWSVDRSNIVGFDRKSNELSIAQSCEIRQLHAG